MLALPRGSELLYRVVFTSEAVGSTGRTTLSVAEILGASERNNRRDEIGSVMLVRDGRIAQMAEGMRGDLDRLLSRLSCDARHRNLKVVGDRPVMQRRLKEPMRLCGLDAAEVEAFTRGRPLDHLSADELERLLGACRNLGSAARAA